MTLRSVPTPPREPGLLESYTLLKAEQAKLRTAAQTAEHEAEQLLRLADLPTTRASDARKLRAAAARIAKIVDAPLERGLIPPRDSS